MVADSIFSGEGRCQQRFGTFEAPSQVIVGENSPGTLISHAGCFGVKHSPVAYRFATNFMYSLSVTNLYPRALRSEINSGIITVVDDNS